MVQVTVVLHANACVGHAADSECLPGRAGPAGYSCDGRPRRASTTVTVTAGLARAGPPSSRRVNQSGRTILRTMDLKYGKTRDSATDEAGAGGDLLPARNLRTLAGSF